MCPPSPSSRYETLSGKEIKTLLDGKNIRLPSSKAAQDAKKAVARAKAAVKGVKATKGAEGTSGTAAAN